MREQEALGSITASVTHEMQNALAVIRESAGLAEDLIGLCQGLGPKGDRLLSAVKLIQEQAARCGDLAWNLNRFAHAWEDVEGGRDLAGVLDELVCLARRRCSVKGVRIGTAPAEAPVRTSAPGLPLRLALFEALDRCLDAGADRLTLQPASVDGRPAVRFNLERQERGPGADRDGAFQAFETSLRDTGARVEDATDDRVRFTVVLNGTCAGETAQNHL